MGGAQGARAAWSRVCAGLEREGGTVLGVVAWMPPTSYPPLAHALQ